MSFFKRLVSRDYRAATAAEAAGNLDTAAERYARAGEPMEAARIHMARAARASERSEEISALQDALHWGGDDPEMSARINERLGRALLARARAEGIAGERDRQRVRDAAAALVIGGRFLVAGEALESINDLPEAAEAYRRGGLVEQLERVLVESEQQSERARRLREAAADYEMNMGIGARDAARDALRICVDVAESAGEYRRLLDQLESRMITGDRVTLERRHDGPIIVCAAEVIGIGRDPLCEMPLRAGGISRRHAEILVHRRPVGAAWFSLRDADSRNGTRIADMTIAGTVPLLGRGQFDLGDECTLEYAADQPADLLCLRVMRGMDKGTWLVAGRSDQDMDLEPPCGLPLVVRFERGRPYARAARADAGLKLGHEPMVQGSVQLVSGDALSIGGVEVDIS